MKNYLLISALLVSQCACSVSQPTPPSSAALLDFDDLAAEISVTHEIVATTAAVKDASPSESTD